jgi:hypothetical protein
MTTSPAAGPETPKVDPLNEPTTTPPTKPAMIPANTRSGLPVDASPRPRHKGRATRKTTMLDGISCLIFRRGIRKIIFYFKMIDTL